VNVQVAADRRGPLFGRDGELGQLDEALAGAAEGRGRLLLLVGEPGIGKSRLAEAFAEVCAARGATIAWGRAWEAGGAPAYWPWIEVLRGLLLDRIDPTAPGLAAVAQILPEVRDRVPDLPPPPPLEPAQALFRLYDAVASLVRHLARDAPLVVILDDLHAADVPTLALLHFVARGLASARVLVVGSYREVEARMSPDVADALARVAREGRYLPLARLDRDQVASWARASGVADPELGSLLYRRSEGNPLFLVELLRLLGEKRGCAGAALEGEIPLGVRDVIRHRLARLPAEARALLDLAAVLGRHADLDLLAHAAGASTGRIRETLAPALEADLMIDAGPALSFSHVLVRDVLHAELPAPRRAELHQTVADELLARRDGAADAPLDELVHHLFAAAPVAGVDRAIEWARRAAAQAMGRLAFADAAGMVDRALAALPPGRDPDRFELLLELAAAQLGAGQVDAGHETCLRAVALARRLRDADGLARAALIYGSVFVFARIDRTLIGLLDEALASLPAEDTPVRAQLLGRLAAALQPAPDPDVPMAIARDAIAMTRRLGEPAIHLDVLHAGSSALLYFADPAERIGLNRELVALAGRLGDKVRVLRGHLRLVVDYLEAGDARRADAALEELDTLAREMGLPAHLWTAAMTRAMRCVMRGRFAEAEELADRAREIADQIEDPARSLTFTMHRIGLLRAAARHEELARFAGPATDALRLTDIPYARSCLAALHARIGQPAAARAALGEDVDDLSWAAGRLQLVWLAEVAAAAEDRALAERIAPLWPRVSGRNHAWGVGAMVCEGPIARGQGLVAMLLERYDDAERHFEEALVRVEALGAPPHRARIELEYAAALGRRGGAGDGDRARRLLDSAVHTSDELGMPGLAAAATALADELPRKAPAATVSVAAPQVTSLELPETPAFELQREGEYWSIACEGRVFRLRDSRGLQILARLVSAPDRPFHVTDLLAPGGEAGLVEDAGEALDPQAIADYRERLAELREDLVRAEDWNDEGRAARVRDEMEFVAAELARGVGLGGRSRRAGSTSEKARINVRRRLLDTIEKITEHSPALGQHLTWALRTGNFCVYQAGGPRPGRR
jgi:tetratricopeptide (TPR) repeat protein